MSSILKIQLSRDDILYREGDSNEYAFVIETGEVLLYQGSFDQRTDVERRGAGSIIGELSILTGQRRTVTVKALTPCIVYRIPAKQILRRFKKLDPILRACIDTSINFTSTLSKQGVATGQEVPLASSTLRDSARVIERFRLEADLVKGLEAGQFSLAYQPIVELPQGTIVGFEALARWQHMQLGNVPPDQFIEVAETTGAIQLITEFALKETCAALRRINETASFSNQLFASINISGQDISRQGFVDFLTFVMDSNDLNSSQIKLEVTETALITDIGHADKNLKRLRSLGIGISVDDFGTGYSNLAYLKTLPLTSLKIDRVFAGDAHSNLVSQSIVKMLVTLGRDLGVDIIAEGLETSGDVETLCKLGCNFAQGYFFHKPMSEADLIELILRKSEQINVA